MADRIREDTVALLLKKYPEGFGVTQMPEVLMESMRIIGAVKELSGEFKKKLVIDILQDLIDKTDSGAYDEELDNILKRMIPNLIDTIISVANGQTVLVPSRTKGIFGCCK